MATEREGAVRLPEAIEQRILNISWVFRVSASELRELAEAAYRAGQEEASNKRCLCHLGSVCTEACFHGKHHDGCMIEPLRESDDPELADAVLVTPTYVLMTREAWEQENRIHRERLAVKDATFTRVRQLVEAWLALREDDPSRPGHLICRDVLAALDGTAGEDT